MAEKIIGLSVIADEEIYLANDLVIKGDKGDIYVPDVENDRESENYGLLTWHLMEEPPEETLPAINIIGPNGKVFTPIVDESTGLISWALKVEPDTPGAVNIRGPRGLTGTLTIGTVSTGAANSAAIVENVGTPEDAILNITIPQGIQGERGIQGETGKQGIQGLSGTQKIGTVLTTEAGSTATVTNVGTPENAIWNITIPKGDKGETGSDLNVLDAYDTVDELYAAHNTGNPGDGYFVGNQLYVWSETLNDWKNTGVTNGIDYGVQIHRWEETD